MKEKGRLESFLSPLLVTSSSIWLIVLRKRHTLADAMKALIGLLVFTGVLTLLHLTSYPSLAGGDSGELLAEACVSMFNCCWHVIQKLTLAIIS